MGFVEQVEPRIWVAVFGGLVLLALSVRVLKEFERGVLLRFGRFKKVKKPGVVFLIPIVDRLIKVDMRTVSFDVPRQETITRDNVPVVVDAVVYYRIVDARASVIEVTNFHQATFLMAQSALRSVIGSVLLDELLSEREKVNQQLCEIIASQTAPWGVEVLVVEIKEISLPEQMKRAMAMEAEMERQRRARLIAADAELQTAETLRKAAEILSRNPVSLHLRYLESLGTLASSKSTIVVPLPLEVLTAFRKYPSSSEANKPE